MLIQSYDIMHNVAQKQQLCLFIALKESCITIKFIVAEYIKNNLLGKMTLQFVTL